jgi:large subunit ribosomal protein L10
MERKAGHRRGLAEKLRGSSSGVFVDYRGLTVAEDTALRRELRQSGVEYGVVKNTLTRFAVDKVGFKELDPVLNGTRP